MLCSLCKVYFIQKSGKGNFTLASFMPEWIFSVMSWLVWNRSQQLHQRATLPQCPLNLPWGKGMNIYSWCGLADEL